MPLVESTEPFEQVMTRQYHTSSQYPREELDYYRQSSRSIGSRLSHERPMPLVDAPLGRDNHRVCPLSRQSPRISPTQDPQACSGSNAPRRRIAVAIARNAPTSKVVHPAACGRCRKRKIKCSGDPMDGSGCNNCKTSGTDPGQCLFLRVQCEVRELVPDHVQLTRGYNQVSSVECPPNVWSYSSNLGSATSQMSGSIGTLSASTNTSIGSVVPMAVPSSNYPRMGLSQGYASGHYSAMPSKAAFSGQYMTEYSDDDPYNLHTPPYMLPSQDSLSLGGAYGPHDTLRGWGPMGQNSKQTSGGLFLDQDSSPSYGNAHLPYLHPVVSRIPSATTDGSSLFPAMTSLVTSLPAPSTAGDRVLPNPALGRPQTSTTTLISTGTAGGDSLNYYGSAQPVGYKSSHAWGCDSSVSVGSQGPTLATPSTGSGPMSPSTRKGSATNFTDTSLGYISISNTPESPSSATPALSYNSANLPAPVVQSNNYGSSVTSTFPPSSSNTALLPSHSTGHMYTYSTESNVSKRDSVGDATASDEGTLISGQTYTRIRQPHLQHPVSMDGLRRASLELRPYPVQQSSVNGLTTGKGY